MKKYPEIETKVTRINDTTVKAVSKTKVPCGAVIMKVLEKDDVVTAKIYAQRECKWLADLHVHKHQCK